MTSDYSDILYLPHHQSRTRPHMTAHDRAAQFAPFAALTGFGAAICETARLTDSKPELTEEQAALLNAQMQWLAENAGSRPEAVFTCFVPDKRKEGGSLRTVEGKVRRVDEVQKLLFFTDGAVLNMEDIIAMRNSECGIRNECRVGRSV